MKSDDKAVSCNLCDWSRVIPFGNEMATKIIYAHSLYSHYVETGHYDSTFPVVAGPNVPEPTLHELQVGRAYSVGMADARKDAAARVLKVIRSLENEAEQVTRSAGSTKKQPT